MSQRVYLLLALLCLSVIQMNAQRVGISEDNAVPNANAILDIKSSTKGVLLPRTSTTSRLAIPNTKGMMVYDTTAGSFFYNTGTGWMRIDGSTALSAADITGYWKGGVGNVITIIHHPNGQARIYFFFPEAISVDTLTQPTMKFNGTWQINGDMYTATFGEPGVSYSFSALVRSPVMFISGLVDAISPNSKVATPFCMFRQ